MAYGTVTPSRAESRARADAIRTEASTESEIKLGREREKTRRERAQDEEKAQRRQEKAKRKRVKARRKRWAAHRRALGRLVGRVRSDVVQAYATVVYLAAVSAAVYGQVSAVRAADEPWLLGAAMAVFIEGVGLTMALTADQLRRAGERALLPQALVWVFTGAAAGINLVAHLDDLVVGVGLALASVTGITVWEIRSRARARRALRDAGKLPEPMVRFGPRRWVWHLPSTWRAYRLDVAGRVSPEAAALLDRVDQERRNRRQERAERGGRRAERFRNAAFRRTARAAKMALKRLSKAGAGGPALAALERYAAVQERRSSQVTAVIEPGEREATERAERNERNEERQEQPVPNPFRELSDDEFDHAVRALFDRLNPPGEEEFPDPWALAVPLERNGEEHPGGVPGTFPERPGTEVAGVDPLLQVACVVRDEVAREGRQMTVKRLAAGLRARGHQVSTERAAELRRLVLSDAG